LPTHLWPGSHKSQARKRRARKIKWGE